MRKLSTGEPCAGEPLARFGGSGESGKTLLYPYTNIAAYRRNDFQVVLVLWGAIRQQIFRSSVRFGFYERATCVSMGNARIADELIRIDL